MADLVLTIGYSHTPYLFAEPSMWERVRDKIRKGKPPRADLPHETPAELQAKYDRAMAAFARLRESIRRSRADVLVILGDDQKEIFSSIVASFTVYCGKAMTGKKWPGRVREVNDNQEISTVDNHPALARDIIDGMASEGFDVAFFDEPENQQDGFGHAFVPPLHQLAPGSDLRVVPILINCYYPPQPTARRCFEFGLALRRIIERTAAAQRIAVTASGGLWHTPGKADACIDEAFDGNFLRALETGDRETLVSLPESRLQSGTGEIRNWIVAAGVAGGANWDVIDYIPLYYSPIGLGFAECREDEP